jgi:hypothetical protein
MGEFLLSFLGFSADGEVVYTRRLKSSQYRVGDAVPFVYPNPHRKTKRHYYRILEKFYEPELIVELIRTQNPDIIDQDGFVVYQRRLRGKDMFKLASTGHSFIQIAQAYGWHKLAVEHAINAYKTWQEQLDAEERKIRPEPEVADMSTLEYYDPDDTPPLVPENLNAEQIAKREALLAQWE